MRISAARFASRELPLLAKIACAGLACPCPQCARGMALQRMKDRFIGKDGVGAAPCLRLLKPSALARPCGCQVPTLLIHHHPP